MSAAPDTASSSPLIRVPSGAAEALNQACFCVSLDEDALARALDSELGQPGLADDGATAMSVSLRSTARVRGGAQLQRMAQVMQAVESVVILPAYREQVLAVAPAIARLGTAGPLGVFFGYDFHLDEGRLGLIEINTNAGGAMLNAVLARAQRACCTAVDADGAHAGQRGGLRAAHRRHVSPRMASVRPGRRCRPLASIAIVDGAPEEQYLYPEFLLFQQLFERHGLRAVIADPAALEWRDGRLWHGELAIDLVYNRLTDFYLEQAGGAALRDAYLQQAVVLTPHPQAHALYADKRHLALFSDGARLQALGVPPATQQILLEHVPRTEVVDAANAQRLWDARRSLFFKPVAGFGSRAAYRGDKLTKRVWQDILAGDYVAQAIVAPGERRVDDADNVQATKAMKFDLRAYTYDGAVQWVAARLYQGQTTNFRTPGGGFAPVYSSADASGRSCHAPEGGCAAGAGHASYVFLLDEAGDVHPVPHALYVALARGQASAPSLAGQTLRLADWYVRLKGGAPDTVVNEAYSRLRFDAQGWVDRAAMATVPVVPDADTPTVAERERMHALLFGAPASTAADGATPCAASAVN